MCVCMLGERASNQNERSLFSFFYSEDSMTFLFVLGQKSETKILVCEEVVYHST